MSSIILILIAIAGLGSVLFQIISLRSSVKPNDKPDEQGFLSATVLDGKGNDVIETSEKRNFWQKFSLACSFTTVILPLVSLIPAHTLHIIFTYIFTCCAHFIC